MSLIKFQYDDIYLLQNLINGQLYFNNVFNFNDPFEGIFRYRLSSDKQAFREFYFKHYQREHNKYEYYLENPGELEKKINKSLEWRYQKNGVCCFSDKSCERNILMWSHYANKHKGVCLVFNDKLRFDSPEMDVNRKVIGRPSGPYKVKYSKKYLNGDPLERTKMQTNFLTTKFKDWSKEKEYRFTSPVSGAFNFNKPSLDKIIFGLRTSISLKSSIKNIISNDPEYNSVEFMKIELGENEFSFQIITDDF